MVVFAVGFELFLVLIGINVDDTMGRNSVVFIQNQFFLILALEHNLQIVRTEPIRIDDLNTINEFNGCCVSVLSKEWNSILSRSNAIKHIGHRFIDEQCVLNLIDWLLVCVVVEILHELAIVNGLLLGFLIDNLLFIDFLLLLFVWITRALTEFVVAAGLPLGYAELLALFVFGGAFGFLDFGIKRQIILGKLALSWEFRLPWCRACRATCT